MTRALRCPACQGDLVFSEPTAARCGRCAGVWLSPKALAARGARLGPEFSAAASSAPRTCPTCQVGLAVYRSPSLEIDACDQCTGIFLDRGELERLVKAHQPTAPATFTCAACRQRAPRTERMVVDGLTVCRTCAPAVGRRAEERVDSGGSVMGGVAGAVAEVAVDGLLEGIVELIIGLF